MCESLHCWIVRQGFCDVIAIILMSNTFCDSSSVRDETDWWFSSCGWGRSVSELICMILWMKISLTDFSTIPSKISCKYIRRKLKISGELLGTAQTWEFLPTNPDEMWPTQPTHCRKHRRVQSWFDVAKSELYRCWCSTSLLSQHLLVGLSDVVLQSSSGRSYVRHENWYLLSFRAFF